MSSWAYLLASDRRFSLYDERFSPTSSWPLAPAGTTSSHLPQGPSPISKRNHRIQIAFDDQRLPANVGLLPRPGPRPRELVDHHLDLSSAPGRANSGDKLLTLVASALAGGDGIYDTVALRAGVLGSVVKAPSSLVTFLRSFRRGTSVNSTA